MITGKNAETAGVVRHGFVEPKLSRKVGDRFLHLLAGTGFSVSIRSLAILPEAVVHLFEFAKKRLVLSELFQATLTRQLQHPDRVVIRPIPERRVEVPEQSPSRRLPGPPQVETDIAQRLEGRGQGRVYIVGLKRRHGQGTTLLAFSGH